MIELCSPVELEYKNKFDQNITRNCFDSCSVLKRFCCYDSMIRRLKDSWKNYMMKEKYLR